MVLLVGINAKYIHTTPAVRSLQANAGKYRKDVEIAGVHNPITEERKFFQDIYRRKPEAVGFSCYLWNIEYVMGLAGDLKKVLPNLFLFFWRTGSKLSSGGSACKIRIRRPCYGWRGRADLSGIYGILCGW